MIFQGRQSKNSAVPVIFGVIVVLALVLSMSNMQPDYKGVYVRRLDGRRLYQRFSEAAITPPEGWTAATQEELDA